MRTICLTGMLALLFFPLRAQRLEQTINDNWLFMAGNGVTASAPDFDDGNWEPVSLPHSWNSDAYTDKDYYRGEGWYRRRLTVGDPEKSRKLYLHFEAANHTALVFVNGHEAGVHYGGYTAFTVDITPYCRFDTENIIAVMVDNSTGYVPTISGDFTIFGGIYRDVWLVTTPEAHFDMTDNGSRGVFVSTPAVSAESASWQVRTKVFNESDREKAVTVTNILYAPDGTLAGRTEQELTLPAGSWLPVETTPGHVTDPLLWSPETPHLYRVETILSETATGAEFDRVLSRTGFRWFGVDPAEGFFLNGKPYKLRGVCRHQDQYPLANALSDEMHRRDVRMMKDMGANFIRISHYPQDEAILEMCDRLGLLAWEEIPVIDLVHPDPRFDEVCHTMLREMIRAHYNYPSIVMWGYMNEILLRGSTMQGGTRIEADREHALRLAHLLETLLKEEDPSRLSAMAFHGSTVYHEAGFGEITDLIGWNLYQGWYGGNFSGFDTFLEKQHREHPRRPILVSEYGAGSDKRLHSLEPRPFDFSIEYQQAYLEHYLPVIERLPYVMGGAHWNFIDFGSAQRDESMPRINNKGLVYNDRTPKDVYYLFKAWFTGAEPVLHIVSRDWDNRVASGDGTVTYPVKIYTNLPEAELFVNGVSQGVKPALDRVVLFEVPLATGPYRLAARCGEVEDIVDIRSTVIPVVFDRENIAGLELAVNVGSNCSYLSPSSGLTWIADREYSPGGWGYTGGGPHASGNTIGTQTQIKGTTDNPLYQTLVRDIEAYRFDVPAGDYELELLFADVFDRGTVVVHQLGAGAGEKKRNIFSVAVNGRTVMPYTDIAEDAGSFRAVKKRYIVRVDDPEGLTVSFHAAEGTTFLNGIKLRKTD